MQRCTSFYQFLTTNWCFVFTAQLLPGMKLESKFTFQGLLFISFLKNAHILLSSKFHMKMYSGFVLIFNNCVLICCKSTIFLNSIIYIVHCYINGKRLIVSLNAKSKFICTFLLWVSISHASICFWNFFGSMLLVFTLYLFLLSALQ